jgi:hypothetical protein
MSSFSFKVVGVPLGALLSLGSLTTALPAVAAKPNASPPPPTVPVPYTLDLTKSGSSGFINNALFEQVSDSNAAGTGKINSFLRIHALGNEGSEQGYNTDYRGQGGQKLQFDENQSPQFTRSLKLSDVPIVTKDGIKYRQFILDINEPNAQKQEKPLITLDKLQLFLGNAGNLFDYSPTTGFGSNAYKIYDLDANKNSQVALKDINAGSGRYDMFTYIPDSVFTGPNEYVYLYSSFQGEFTQGGFEEWAVKMADTPPPPPPPKKVPEPGTAVALLLAGWGVMRSRRKQVQDR